MTREHLGKVEECTSILVGDEIKAFNLDSTAMEKAKTSIQSIDLAAMPYLSQHFMQFKHTFMNQEEILDIKKSSLLVQGGELNGETSLLSSDKLALQAMSKLNVNEYGEALELLKKAFENSEDLSTPFKIDKLKVASLNLLGSFAQLDTNTNLAITLYQAALELDNKHIMTLLKLSALFGLKGDIVDSENLLKLAETCDEEGQFKAELSFAKATMAADRGDLSKAIAAYQQVHLDRRKRQLSVINLFLKTTKHFDDL